MDTVILNPDGSRAIGFVMESAKGGMRVVMAAGHELTQGQIFDMFGNVTIEVHEMIGAAIGDPMPETCLIKEFRITHWALPSRRPAPVPRPSGGKLIQMPTRPKTWRATIEDAGLILFVSAIVAAVFIAAIVSVSHGA